MKVYIYVYMCIILFRSYGYIFFRSLFCVEARNKLMPHGIVIFVYVDIAGANVLAAAIK